MSPAFSLGWRTLVRRPRRLALFVAGVTVAAAMLLDMIMLSAGLERSLSRLLEATGYQIRVTPPGVLPFETEATIPGSRAIERELEADPRVAEAVPIWGRTVYVTSTGTAELDEPLPAFGMGAPRGTSPTLRLRSGRTLERDDELVINRGLADRLGIEPGDSLTVGLDPNPLMSGPRRRATLRVAGIADFVFAPVEGANVAIEIGRLRRMADAPEDAAALLLVRVGPDADPFEVADDYRGRLRSADVYAIPEIIEAAGDRLSYFHRLSTVLGTVSLAVMFLLIATLLTLSVNERWGEIATLRAIGVTRARTLLQVAWQGLLMSGAGALGGLGFGWVIARYLDRILLDFPGLPPDVSFFVLEPRDAALALGLVVLTGLAAGLYPAWRAAAVNIAAALREEPA